MLSASVSRRHAPAHNRDRHVLHLRRNHRWAEFVTHALAGAAANVGGTEQILAGRPGSWEAERVRQTLQSTVGVDDEHLLQHRTEPVVIDLWVESILRDINDTSYDDYRDAELELSRRQEAIPRAR
jgi:hypothetical protein